MNKNRLRKENVHRLYKKEIESFWNALSVGRKEGDKRVMRVSDNGVLCIKFFVNEEWD